MLTEERLKRILSIVNETGSVTITDLVKELSTSESTIRRDLAYLDRRRDLVKVRGGAVAISRSYGTRDDDVLSRKSRSIEAKRRIAIYAASLIGDEDFVFIDAGTTTELMIPHISNHRAKFVTNSLSHAMKLAELDFTVYILGGEFKNTTEAIVGEEAIASLSKYNFTKGFFGTNGVHKEMGFTTPEVRESLIKRTAMSRCQRCYILADHTKLGSVYSVTFGDYLSAEVLTDSATDGFKDEATITEVGKS